MRANTRSAPNIPELSTAAEFEAERITKTSLNSPESSVTILIYVRPWSTLQMVHLARGVWGPAAKLQLVSEHRSVDQSGLAGAFETAYQQTHRDETLHYLTKSEAADIVLRCRLLRSLQSDQAKRLLVAMENAVNHVLSQIQCSVMLSFTVDSYVMDVFANLCAKRGIRFIGLVPSFIKEHFRITTRGEYVQCRQVSEIEIDAALSTLLIKDYRPDFLVRSESEMRRQMWRLWLRNLAKPLWFALLRLKPGEARNYHYWVSQMFAMRFWSLWPRELSGVSGSALASLGDDGGPPLIYLPLQMSPEATIDYWSIDVRWIDYERYIFEIVRRYRGKWRFAIKEHPNLLGYRSRGFYKQLEAEPNCVMVSPEVPSNELVILCRGVLVCTGTSGFEAALRGKPVLSDSAPYYAVPNTFLPIETLDSDLPVQEHTSARQRELMSHVLRGTLPGRFLNNGTWNVGEPEHRAWSETMAASIRAYLGLPKQTSV